MLSTVCTDIKEIMNECCDSVWQFTEEIDFNVHCADATVSLLVIINAWWSNYLIVYCLVQESCNPRWSALSKERTQTWCCLTRGKYSDQSVRYLTILFHMLQADHNVSCISNKSIFICRKLIMKKCKLLFYRYYYFFHYP